MSQFIEKGKLPPQAKDLEEVILGACLIDSDGLPEAIEVLGGKSEVFYKEEHKYIFTAMVEMFEENQKIDLLTVSERLKKNAQLELVGGDFFLISLTQRVSSSAHIEEHSRIVMQQYVKRESIRVGTRMIEEAYDETKDVFDLLEESHKNLDETAKWLTRKKPDNLKDIYTKIITRNPSSKVGVVSKFHKINKRTGGYQNSDLHIIAARPGMGKTAFIINEGKFQAENKIPVGFLSLEMSSTQLVSRMIAIEFGIDSDRIKRNELTDSERIVLKTESDKIDQLPIHILDQGSLSIMSARTTIGSWVRQFGIKICYIDYLQLMTVGSSNKTGNREQEISYISRSLKAIAKEFDIPIVALSQLSRAVEQRGGSKRPILSDLRESGAIEQDADVVQFIYRPEYYNIDEWDDDERTPSHGQAAIITEKCREGELGETRIKSNLKYMQMDNLEEPFTPLPEQKIYPISSSDAFEVDNDDIGF